MSATTSTCRTVKKPNAEIRSKFVQDHCSQLDLLQIPEPLCSGLQEQLEAAFLGQKIVSREGGEKTCLDIEHLASLPQQSQCSLINRYGRPNKLKSRTSEEKPFSSVDELQYGAMMVLPHVLSWDMLRPSGLIDALQRLRDTNSGTLQMLWQGLQTLCMTPCARPPSSTQTQPNGRSGSSSSLDDLVNAVADHPALWSRVILYRSSSSNGNAVLRAALPAPPYLPFSLNESEGDSGNDGVEADCTGPFPFVYHHTKLNIAIDVSLLYVSPEYLASAEARSSSSITSTKIVDDNWNDCLPTLDLVPFYQFPDATNRKVRYAALLLETNSVSIDTTIAVKEIYMNFVHRMHLVRQAKLPFPLEHSMNGNNDTARSCNDGKVFRVYTDANDPMGLKHPIAGLEANSPHFAMVESWEQADIVYSFHSVFAPGSPLFEYLKHCDREVLINQFPFEGAFVQKDHLARELLKQHGLPRPFWSLETYDLDVHWAEFVGAVVTETDHQRTTEVNLTGRPSLWIVKPSTGTQSKGHVVTSSLAQIVRLLDCTGGGYVAQRYIESPVCMNGRKVDCRCLVLMTSAGDPDQSKLPTLYMHETVYFRIAHKEHVISTANDLADHESVPTASHLLTSAARTTNDAIRKLPFAKDTIEALEAQYAGSFDWKEDILPNIQTMIRELFNGMSRAFPAMGKSKVSRALYGIDVMFEIDDDANDENIDNGIDERRLRITPKLTEVTFCPANNALCDAYVRDEDLERSYNKDIFECLFLNKVSNSLQRLP